MLASGNGNITTCVTNLMAMRRGECAYERVKGLDQDIINETEEAAELDLLEDAEFVIEVFEERVSLEDMEIEPIVYEDNSFEVKFVVTDTENDSDDVDEDE